MDYNKKKLVNTYGLICQVSLVMLYMIGETYRKISQVDLSQQKKYHDFRDYK